jgi:uncharacterized protein YcbX
VIEVGRVAEIMRYPVKSMAGIATQSAFLGWHGLDGDRRFAFRRVGVESGRPWLTASNVPDLICYHPVVGDDHVPTHVRTPSGACLELKSDELRNQLSERFGKPVELMKLKHGIFDDAVLSVISLATVAGIGREIGRDLDPLRFRANIFLETDRSDAFLEEEWLGGMLVFGDGNSPAAVNVTFCDERCVMINLDPNTAEADDRVLKTVVRLNNNLAGVYGSVIHQGTIHAGDRVYLLTSNQKITPPTTRSGSIHA